MQISLITDFGQTEYVGIMKGVITSINKDVRIIDITHSIRPQSVLSAAWILNATYNHFPQNTIFVAVIDPGVGTTRRALCIKTNHYYFIGPDNGILRAAKNDIIKKILSISLKKSLANSSQLSKTFHGRDIFAPAAALLAKNGWQWCVQQWKSLDVNSIQLIDLKPEIGKNGYIRGTIVHIDHFGNIISNINKELIKQPTERQNIIIRDSTGKVSYSLSLPVVETYAKNSDSKSNLIAIFGSNNTLEISIPNASAFSAIPVEIGWEIELL